VATESGAGCTSGACSPVQNTAFPGRACSRKAGPAGARGTSQLLGNRRVPGAGTAAAARLLNYCDGLASTPSRPFVKNHVNKRPAKHGAKCGTPWPCPGRRGGRRSKSGDGGQDLLEHIAQISAALLSSKLLNHL